MKISYKLSLTIIVTLLCLLSQKTFASEVTGTLNTGISGNSSSGVEGVVIVEPTANPGTGTYASTQNITLTASGASSIHYTTDGSVPSCSTGLTYSGSIAVASSKSIKALSCYPSDHHSNVATFTYTINLPVTVVPSGSSGGSSSSSGGSSVSGNASTSTSPQTFAPVFIPQTIVSQTNNIVDTDDQGTSTNDISTTTVETFVSEPINPNNNPNPLTAGVGDALPFDFSQGILWFSLAFLLGLLIYLGYKVVAKGV